MTGLGYFLYALFFFTFGGAVGVVAAALLAAGNAERTD